MCRGFKKILLNKKGSMMEFYITEEGIPISIGSEGAAIAYYGSEIELKYETEPSQGDFIFSGNLPLINIELPFWIYGRNLIFLDAYYLLAEMVEKNTWNPITTVLVDIHTGKYVNLGHWYNSVSVKDNVELKDEFDSKTLVLKNIDKLKWIKMYKN